MRRPRQFERMLALARAVVVGVHHERMQAGAQTEPSTKALLRQRASVPACQGLSETSLGFAVAGLRPWVCSPVLAPLGTVVLT